LEFKNDPPPRGREKKKSRGKKKKSIQVIQVSCRSPLGYHVPKGIRESTHPPLGIPHFLFHRRLVATRYGRWSGIRGCLVSSFLGRILALRSGRLDPLQFGIHLVVHRRIRFTKG
jgi:hypothetical protein